MKKRYSTRSFLLLLALFFAIGAIATVGARYIRELTGESGTLTAPSFYFRSNVLTEDADPTPIAINGSKTTATLSNALGAGKVSDVTITYTLSYYVYKDGEWVLSHADADKTFTKDVLLTDELTLTPIEYDGTVYETIKVVASSSAPFVKTLTAIVAFYPTPFAVSYTYDPTGFVVTAKVKVGSAGGNCSLSWQAGISPDNADENGVLTTASIGPSSLDATLSEHHTYFLKFFVTDEVLHEAIVASGDVNAYLATVIPIVKAD